jgi:hypothetical protein
MPKEREKELRDLKEHTRTVLDLFPWPDDGPVSEGGIERGVVAGLLRTPQQAAAEQDLRHLRDALNNLLGGISKYLREPPEG